MIFVRVFIYTGYSNQTFIQLNLYMYIYCYSTVCFIVWQSRPIFIINALPHWMNWYGLNHVCITIGLLRCFFYIKAMTHCMHGYCILPSGHPLVYIKIYLFRKRFVTFNTLIWFLSIVHLHMFFKFIFLKSLPFWMH